MRNMRTVLLAAGVALAGATLAPFIASVAHAEGRRVKFLGPHPIPAEYGSGYCYIEYPHFHDYEPIHPELYRRHDDAYSFVGDPVPVEGYDGPRVAYYGPHPIPATVAVTDDGQPVYCYIRGPHYHGFAPVDDDGFVVKDDVYWYTGPYAPTYYVQRPEYEQPVNVYYDPIHYQRPIAVDPPPGYSVVVPPPPAGVFIQAPVASAIIAPPVVGVAVEAPVLTVAAPAIVATPPAVAVVPPVVGAWMAPPAAGVVVTAPAAGVVVSPFGVQGVVRPPSVGVVVQAPVAGVVVGAPGVVVGAPPVVLRPHEDEGEHRGWYRGGDEGWHGHGRGR